VSSNVSLFIGLTAVITGPTKSFTVNVTEAVPKFPDKSFAQTVQVFEPCCGTKPENKFDTPLLQDTAVEFVTPPFNEYQHWFKFPSASFGI